MTAQTHYSHHRHTTGSAVRPALLSVMSLPSLSSSPLFSSSSSGGVDEWLMSISLTTRRAMSLMLPLLSSCWHNHDQLHFNWYNVSVRRCSYFLSLCLCCERHYITSIINVSMQRCSSFLSLSLCRERHCTTSIYVCACVYIYIFSFPVFMLWIETV